MTEIQKQLQRSERTKFDVKEEVNVRRNLYSTVKSYRSDILNLKMLLVNIIVELWKNHE